MAKKDEGKSTSETVGKPKLTDKQQRFVEEYLIDLNATQAAIRAGYNLTKNYLTKYYVYFLIDPRNENIFYVGKGTGNRISQHARNARCGIIDNAEKFNRILEIQTSGNEVSEIMFFGTDDESLAFLIERILIKKLHNFGLTNISGGISTNKEKARVRSKLLLSRIKSFEQWRPQLSDELLLQVKRVWGNPEACYGYIKSSLTELLS
ncbi:terminase small subunit [Actinobacillus pleuropneumoniae]|uniref:GIY-YIG nuclease family protein n=1 Tax=Actinobacillus pleuropneumoniae TaxID=715 RepID=UPI003CFC80F9